MSKIKKACLIVVCIVLVLALGVGAFFLGGGLLVGSAAKQVTVRQEDFTAGADVDRIHFLNTGSSDAILLESNGHFALVDSGEDSDYPADKPNLNLQGYEEQVLAYLKAHAADANGKVTLDFVVGTHAHSDHIGGFDTIIADQDVTVKKAYLKTYEPEKIKAYERNNWDNEEVYRQMVDALQGKNVPVTDQFEQTTLGDFTVTFYNTGYDTSGKLIGENDNSLAIKVEKGGKSALLSGDMDNLNGDEKAYGAQIGKVDLLKLGHHGYIGSSTPGYIKTLSPKIAIATNWEKKVYPNVKWTLGLRKIPLFAAADHNGLVATFTDGGDIQLTNNCMG